MADGFEVTDAMVGSHSFDVSFNISCRASFV